jgi:hypothetical protein
MVSAKLKRLRDTFAAWSRGDPFPDEESWLQFGHDLREVTFAVAMLELGVDLTVVDIAVEAARPDSNVMVFPQPRAARGANRDGAS